ncbi:hypothetical protein HPULCUR_002966 [Helicostylum pulchrum]|uniref:Uncharacterized protein n=1 Tax=Helicostylum pulchrum TaxID=562976 RepID=A0ABP9XS26_9FUNG
MKEENIAIDLKQEDIEAEEKIPIEKYLFYIGFVFPIAWFIGSTTKGYSYSSYVWKKRCRIAVTLMLVLAIVMVATVMVVKPTLFGLKSDIGAQTSAATNNAIRPGVPILGTNDFGDTVAGISVDSNE